MNGVLLVLDMLGATIQQLRDRIAELEQQNQYLNDALASRPAEATEAS